MNILLKAKYSFYSALVFFLCANPETFKILFKLFGGGLASSAGCPTPVGLFFATILFFCVMLALMMFPRD
jgi:hypothetical protein